MDEKTMKAIERLQNVVGDTWIGLCVMAGIKAGYFAILSKDNPITIKDVVDKYGYKTEKVEKWFYFAETNGILEKKSNTYVLSPFGQLCTPHSPLKALYGFLLATDFFMQSAIEAKETFKKNRSLDKLTEGKISRDYQPKVSDNLSAILLKHFKESDIHPKDTLLDFGCGNGNFLRILSKQLPEVQFAGVDSNLFSIETGKKENSKVGLSDRVKLYVGDLTTEMTDFENASYDWVIAINLYHFIPPDKRKNVVDNMIRIARKGVFMTEAITEANKLTSAGNVLLTLLWNDFTGTFDKAELDEFNKYIKKKYRKLSFKFEPIMQGTSSLVIISKQE